MKSPSVLQITKLAIALAVCVTFAGVVHSQNTSETRVQPEYNDADGYAVLSALIERMHSVNDSLFQLAPQTVSGITPDSFDSCKRIPAEFKSAAVDFREKNQQSWRLLKKFNLTFKFVFADEVNRDLPPPAPGEQEFQLPPDPVVSLSVVGFDASRRHAIVYLAVVCGPECRGGGYYLMVKNKYGWTEAVDSPACKWISFNNELAHSWKVV
jgi:hypothetical protein